MSTDGEAGRRGDGVRQVVPDTGYSGTSRPVADRRVTYLQNEDGRGRRRAQPAPEIGPQHDEAEWRGMPDK